MVKNDYMTENELCRGIHRRRACAAQYRSGEEGERPPGCQGCGNFSWDADDGVEEDKKEDRK